MRMRRRMGLLRLQIQCLSLHSTRQMEKVWMIFSETPAMSILYETCSHRSSFLGLLTMRGMRLTHSRTRTGVPNSGMLRKPNRTTMCHIKGSFVPLLQMHLERIRSRHDMI
ncbi:hypothetical protein BKA58DRAFT_386315 [Alternaria rosae]|uniref:uncharacterized protein n=1 Tax=Alternaria rosae TaxID=1187941 RepID=UPI001E8E7602|nr:uncharacterized protein BKA58DRAFT_386315 [Alternaria rosae]KAH6868120.1 hypothetical protein BKA58DRAFT_386315 [Alternaria rosae]